MTIRVILVPLFGSQTDALCLMAGTTIAQRFGAHVDGLFVRIDPTDVVPALGDGVSPAIIRELTEAAAGQIERQRASRWSTGRARTRRPRHVSALAALW
jgi:hypothetical protein